MNSATVCSVTCGMRTTSVNSYRFSLLPISITAIAWSPGFTVNLQTISSIFRSVGVLTLTLQLKLLLKENSMHFFFIEKIRGFVRPLKS